MIEVAIPSREEWELQYKEKDSQHRAEWQRLLALDEPLLDDDGYPTDHACELVERWHWCDPSGWFSFIKSIWYLADWGWHEEDGVNDFSKESIRVYHISTAGWSGNESLIRSMEKNQILWSSTWVQSRRGGHYIFEVEVE